MIQIMHCMFYLKIFKDNEKRTPLHAAAYLGDAEIIELLILSGKHSSILIYKCSSLLLVFFLLHRSVITIKYILFCLKFTVTSSDQAESISKQKKLKIK